MAFAAAASQLATRTSVTHSFQTQRRPVPAGRLAARRLVARAAADVGADQSSPSAVRKALLARGWDLAWIDGVTGEMIKGRLSASVPQIEAAVSYLEGLGIPLKAVENMAAMNKLILAQPVDRLRAVVEYAERQGTSGAALITLLEAHPNLLTYAVSADGKQLEKGQARASVDVAERSGRKVAGVSYWREGASFEGTPVVPYKPSAL